MSRREVIQELAKYVWHTFGTYTITGVRGRYEVAPEAKSLVRAVCAWVQKLDIEPDDLEPGVIAAVISVERSNSSSIRFRNDVNTGLYHSGSGQLRLAVGGRDVSIAIKDNRLHPKWHGFMLNVHSAILKLHQEKITGASRILGS